MKKSIFLFVAICFSIATSAQSFVDDNYSKLMDDDNSTVVFVSGKLFDFASYIDVSHEEAEVQEMKDLITSIEQFSLVRSEHLNDPYAEYKKGISAINSNYEELVRVRDKKNNLSIYIDEDNGIVHEIVGLASTEDNEFIVASLLGEIDLNQVSKLVSKFQEKGMPMISDIEELELEDVKVYPNPAKADTEITLEVGDSFMGGSATVFDLNGKVMATYTIDQSNLYISTDNYPNGQYFVEASKGTVSVKKQIIVLK